MGHVLNDFWQNVLRQHVLRNASLYFFCRLGGNCMWTMLCTAILSCRYGPHEKIMKNRVGSTWFEIQAKSSLLGAEKLQGEHELSFRTSRRRFPRTEKDGESSIAAYKLQLTPPAGTEAPPAGTEGFSSKLFNLPSSSLGRFRRMNPRWKAWNPSKTTAPFLFPCRQGNER